MRRTLAVLALLLPLVATAQEEATAWIRTDGVEGYAWGSDSMPTDGVPRPRDLVLPDSHFIGANKQDRPEDLELKGPPGERRFVRYARGTLVDAWLLAERPLDPFPLTQGEKPAWTGVILGPGEDGFLAYGVASSWTIGARTVLHWKDRLGTREVLVSRAAPTPQYGIGRPSPLQPPGDTGSRPKLTGDFKKEAKPLAGPLGSCFDTSPKPVGATIELRLDARGAPSRIKVSADQPAFDLEDCVAAALLDLRGPANAAGKLELLRFQ